MMKDDLIQEIIQLEWEMFDAVENQGGRASCQNDPKGFAVMRGSQLQTWSTEVLSAYFLDLQNASAIGRNLLEEKYARMMESTHPTEYVQFADQLPPVSDESNALIEEMIAWHLNWQRELAEQYPYLREQGRPLTTQEDTPWQTSFETYMRGEYKTYSANTISLLYRYTKECVEQGVNLAIANLRQMILLSGYTSLEEANAVIAAKRQ